MAIQGKYRSDTASRIRCCIDINEGMAATWNLWLNLETIGPPKNIQE